MDSAKICAVALIVIGAAAIIKQVGAGFSIPLRASALMVFAALLLISARPAIEYLNELSLSVGFSKYAAVILKGFGVALLCHGCASVCRDSGEATVASCVELAGKIEIFLLCVPLINDLLEVVQELIYLT
ncbi:MAG: hypothetical protein E7640_00305 [Ruminococcaceae bacterium]|nr:hypothetical protein [Oscillospiraceae bacterium]